MWVLLACHGCHLLSNRKSPAPSAPPENIPAAEIAPWQLPQPASSHVKQEFAELGFHQGLHLRRLGGPPSASATQVSPSIVVIIIVLTVIFFLSAFLHLLIRWLARNPALIRRGFRTSTSSSTGSNNRIVTLTALQGQLQQLFSLQDAGLDRSLIEELPVFSYKAAMDGLKEGADCAICLCEFVADDQLRLLPLCGHAFHTECIDTWLLSHSTCPLCRALLLPGCWIPDTLHPLLSSEMSIAGEAEAHRQAADVAAPAPVSGRFPGLSTSSRRTSLGRVHTIIAGTNAAPIVDRHNHVSQASAEPQLLVGNPFTSISDHTDRPMSDDPYFGNPTLLGTKSSRGMTSSARLECSDHERSLSLTRIGNLCMISDPEDRVDHSGNKGASEGTSSANAKWSNSGIATMIMDSGRLSYASLGNQTDVQSETYNEVDRASAYGSGRRVSVHLGKCRMVHEEGVKGTLNVPKMSGDASRRTYSKGSYEYVIDCSSNLEVIIPPAITLNPHSRPPAMISASKCSELFSASNRTSLSSAEAPPTVAHGHRDLVSKGLGLSWASASFRKFALCDGVDEHTIVEEMDVPLNRSQPSDKPASVDALPVVGIPLEFAESSGATSMRANVGSDASLSPEIVSQRLRELNIVGASINAAAAHEAAKLGAVSFRLPTTTSHDVLCARLKASASRRALSESEAFSHWEPTITEQDLAHPSDDRRLFLDESTASHRSSSFARRTVDWLVGWQKRMVHPDK